MLNVTKTVTNRVEHAIKLAQMKGANGRGIHVIPLHSLLDGLCSCGNKGCENIAKHPINDWKNTATNNVAQIQEIWKKFSYANIGVVTGNKSGVFVLDVDGAEGQSTIQEWVLEHGEFTSTYQVKTGRGYHLYYKCPNFEVPTLRGSLGEGIDIRGENGYVVGEGSTHRNGFIYTCMRDIPFADAPSFLLEMLREREIMKVDSSGVDIRGYSGIDMLERLEYEAVGNIWIRNILRGESKFQSHSEIDMSLANCLVKNGWSDKDIASALYSLRVEWGEKLKHDGYYASTVAKAKEWGEKSMRNVIEIEELDPIKEEIEPTPSVREFPMHVFPKDIRDFIESLAKASQVPNDLVGVHVLTLLGTAVGATRRIHVKRVWQDQPNLFSVIVADPGAGKSPILSQVFKPVKKYHQRLENQYMKELRRYEEAIENNEEATEPIEYEAFVDKTTVEGLITPLKNNPRGIVLKGDELSGWFASFNQYKGGLGDDEQFYLSAFSGTDVKVNRANKPKVYIPNTFLAVTGNVTPSTIEKLRSKEDNGFLDRLLISYPEDFGVKVFNEDDVPIEIEQAYHHVFEVLFEYDFKLDGEPHVLHFSPQTKKTVWKPFYDRIMKEVHENDFNEKLKGVWAKMPSQVARMALILQCAWSVAENKSENEIEADILRYAIALGDYFMSHAKKVYFHLAQTEQDEHMRKIIQLTKDKGGKITPREVARKQWKGLTPTDKVKEVFYEMCELGYGYMTKSKSGKQGGRKSEHFVLY